MENNEMKNKTYKYLGQQSIAAINNFGTGLLPYDYIKYFAMVKKSAIIAIQNVIQKWEKNIYLIILETIDEIIEGKHNNLFSIPLKQGGAGTSINMFFNEIISNIAKEKYLLKYKKEILLDPIEDINLFQSTNDLIPTALTAMLYYYLNTIENKIIKLQEIFVTKEEEFSNILITGRTQMQDALPIRLGQIFGGYASAIQRDRWRTNKLKERVRTIALGGTAIGTCFFAPREYIFEVEKILRKETGLPLSRSQNLIDEISNQDKYVEVSNGFQIIANTLIKISNDFLIYTSSFLNEIKHPELQYGSSIMAAKTNPVILEFVKGLCIDTIGETNKILLYCQNGNLQLNPFLPFIIESFFNIKSNLCKAIDSFIDKFLNKITINHKIIEKNFVNSFALINSLVPFLGYNKVKEIYTLIKDKEIKSFSELKEILLKNTELNEEKINRIFEPYFLTGFLKEL